LRAIGAALAACARRPGDVVARYGGEEFALIATFPANVANGANVLGDAICRAAADLGLPHCESPHAVVTVSVGIAVTSAGWRGDPLELLRVADEALYKAKREGRNRFEIDHIEGCKAQQRDREDGSTARAADFSERCDIGRDSVNDCSAGN
jgi:diguanylate cyclase (GGDEF)-like protein